MEPFRPSFRRRLARITGYFAKLATTLRPQAQEVRSQRMCPFCGLITPRAERLCLECGKPLRAVQGEGKAAHQE
jgi:predicted amidophosphoribosyltransferase